MKIRFATVCSGIGAPEMAAEALGWECAFSSDIEAFPNAVRAHHWPAVPNLGDMTRFMEWPARCVCAGEPVLVQRKLKVGKKKHKMYVCSKCAGIRLDVLIGGTPCQSFSVAGLRRGMADPRGNLALTFLAIVDRYRPTWVLWENVPGVHSSWSDAETFAAAEGNCVALIEARQAVVESGLDLGAEFGLEQFEEVDQSSDFDCFLAALEQLVYGIASGIYDAQYFGVAQRRRRVFVVGHIGGQWQRAAAVLFERESLSGNPPPRRETGQGPAGQAKGGVGTGGQYEIASGLGHSGRGYERAGETRGQDPVVAVEKEGFSTSGDGYWRDGIGALRGREQDSHENLTTAIRTAQTSANGHGIANEVAHTLDQVNGQAVAQPIGIDGTEVGFALRANASHSGDKGDGGVNTTMVAELAPPLREHVRNNSNPATECSMLIGWQVGRMWEHGRFHCKNCGHNFGVYDYESNIVTCPKCQNNSSHTIHDFLQDGGAVDEGFRASGNCGAWSTGDKTDALCTATDPNSHIVVKEIASTLRACSSTEAGHAARAGDKDENLVAHALRAEGFDASEDGTGRGHSPCAHNDEPGDRDQSNVE